MLTDIVSPEVFEWDVAVPAAEQVEVLPVQDAGVLASRTGDPVTKRRAFKVSRETRDVIMLCT